MALGITGVVGVRLWVAAMGCRRIAVVAKKGDMHGATGRGLSVYGSSRIWLHKAIAKVVVFIRRKEGRKGSLEIMGFLL